MTTTTIKRFLLFVGILLSFANTFAQEVSAKKQAAPQANNDSLLMGKNQLGIIDVLLNDQDLDQDIDSNSISVVQIPSFGIFQIVNKKVHYSPSTNQCGLDSIKYQIKDLAGASSNIATIYIQVTCVNLPPLARNDSLTLMEDDSATLNVFDNDEFLDGPGLAFQIILPAVHGNVRLDSNGILKYAGNANYFGSDSALYRYCDRDPDDERCDSAWIYFEVESVNDAPIAMPDSFSVFQGIAFSGSLTSNDSSIDGPSVSMQILQNPQQGVLTANANGDFTYTANNSFVGMDSVRYTHCDAAAPSLCDTAWAYFSVAVVFAQPIATDDTIRIPVNTSIVFNILQNDRSFFPIDLSSLNFQNNNPSLSITLTDSTLSIIPANNYVGKSIIPYSFKDLNDSNSTVGSISVWVGVQPQGMDQCPIIFPINSTVLVFPFMNATAGTAAIDFSQIQIIQEPSSITIESFQRSNQSLVVNSGMNPVLDTLRLLIYDEDGFNSDTITICFETISDVVLKPLQAMSPNGDGINDAWIIENIDIFSDNSVEVFDINGNTVYNKTGYNNAEAWTPDALPTGTYYFIIKTDMFGKSKVDNGYFTIIK